MGDFKEVEVYPKLVVKTKIMGSIQAKFSKTTLEVLGTLIVDLGNLMIEVQEHQFSIVNPVVEFGKHLL